MRSASVALLVAATIALSGLAYAAFVVVEPTPQAALLPPEAHDAMHHEAADAHGSGAHDWHGGAGQVPTLADALLKLERRDSIVIQGDKAFNPANGVRSGSGTFEDPFVISGWYVDTILVKDTTKAFEIKDDYVGTILVLDWTGQGGYVHHNHLENLRTNRNVQRTGDPSATVIENNEILRVQELRHFDGEVRNNTIGQPDALLRLTQPDVIFNIAGLNGAGIHDNLVYGGVDMKLHGHHHSDHEGGVSHNHAATHENDTYANGTKPDHTVRYVNFQFYANRIVDDKFGMRYNDLNHAGDDREATSEQNPDLELPHVHHTRVAIHDNVIDGATLSIATINAPDERHLPGESAVLDIYANKIVQPKAGNGITVQDVRDATVLVHGNTVEKSSLQTGAGAGILLQRFHNDSVVVWGNELGAYTFGVQASRFDNMTSWTVKDNQAPGAKYPVYYDSSVANPPGGAPAQPEPEHDHGHDAATDATGLARLLR